MYQKLERPITDKDRQQLQSCIPLATHPFSTRSFKIKLLGEWAGVITAISILIWFKKQPAAFVIPIACGLYFTWWLFHLKRRVLEPLRKWRQTSEHIQKFGNAIAAAQTIVVQHITARAVVKLNHDEGMICLFDIGPDQTFWFDPTDLTPSHSPSNWPNQEFEILRIPSWDHEIGPFSRGKRLTAQKPHESKLNCPPRLRGKLSTLCSK
jgi:hypothetical protein